MNVNGYWEAVIRQQNGQSFLDESRRTYPLDVVPYNSSDGALLIYLLMGSPGFLNGDYQSIECWITEAAHLLLTDPSPAELRPAAYEDDSQQTQVFHLERNSVLEYMPKPLIPFKGSRHKGSLSLYLSSGAQTVIGKIVTAGRTGSGEAFEYSAYESTFEVFMGEKMAVWDTMKLLPDMNLQQSGLLGNFTHIGTLWMLSEHMTNNHLVSLQEMLRETDPEQCYAGVSKLQDNGCAIRLLGYAAEDLQAVMKQCWDYFRVYLLNKQPVTIP